MAWIWSRGEESWRPPGGEGLDLPVRVERGSEDGVGPRGRPSFGEVGV